MKFSALLLGLVSALVAACGSGSNTRESEVPAQPHAAPEPVAKQNETPSPEGGHIPNDEPLVALQKPQSQWQIGGKSLSTVSVVELREAFVKAGCELKGDTREGRDLYDRLSFDCEPKGAKGPGTVVLVRPAATPERAKEKAKAPVELNSGDHHTRSSWVYDEAADVYLEMALVDHGTKEQADKLIKAVLKKGK